ncbi:hypothetical protein [Kribbella sp. NPDC004875]|uniref:hypothetical protein n=1 Tax=Kribbella sp. NPDC004875 TaxID=3364107 RepID=UPI0036C2AB17
MAGEVSEPADRPEPVEPTRIIMPGEEHTDPRAGVADARGAVLRRPRSWRGRGGVRRPGSAERQNNGREPRN